jgi:hypothetical protein
MRTRYPASRAGSCLAALAAGVTSCATSPSPPPRNVTRVAAPPQQEADQTLAAPPASLALPNTVFVRVISLIPEECAAAHAALSTPLSAADSDPSARYAACVDEHRVTVPLACFGGGKWRTGSECLGHRGSMRTVPARCTIEGSGDAWVPGVAVRTDDARPAFVVDGGRGTPWRPEPEPQDGEGLSVDPAFETEVRSAIERDIIRPAPAFLVRQQVARDLDGDGKPDRLLNVRVVALPHPTTGLTERHALYLFSGNGAPLALGITSGDRPTESYSILASTDLDGDGRFELVLRTEDYSAPVETALVEVRNGRLLKRAGLACTEAGLVRSPP